MDLSASLALNKLPIATFSWSKYGTCTRIDNESALWRNAKVRNVLGVWKHACSYFFSRKIGAAKSTVNMCLSRVRHKFLFYIFFNLVIFIATT